MGVFACRQEQFFAADDVHGALLPLPIVVRIMRTRQHLAGFPRG